MAKNNQTTVKNADLGLMVKRELIPDYQTRSGAEMYAYVLSEMVKVAGREREIRVDFAVKNKDYDGYEMLDIIFMLGEEAHLRVKEDSMVDRDTGVVTPYSTYEIWNKDEDGVEYSYKVTPQYESDKAKLNVLIQKAQIRLAAIEEKADAVEQSPKNNETKNN